MSFWFKITTIFQRTQSNHNCVRMCNTFSEVQNYHDFSKNAIKSQLIQTFFVFLICSKLPRFFKERNQITTLYFRGSIYVVFKITTIFQRTQSNHNSVNPICLQPIVQNYHDFSKNAIKSQRCLCAHTLPPGSKLPRFFKERNQITTPVRPLFSLFLFKITTIFQRTQSNHNA